MVTENENGFFNFIMFELHTVLEFKTIGRFRWTWPVSDVFKFLYDSLFLGRQLKKTKPQ